MISNRPTEPELETLFGDMRERFPHINDETHAALRVIFTATRNAVVSLGALIITHRGGPLEPSDAGALTEVGVEAFRRTATAIVVSRNYPPTTRGMVAGLAVRGEDQLRETIAGVARGLIGESANAVQTPLQTDPPRR